MLDGTEREHLHMTREALRNAQERLGDALEKFDSGSYDDALAAYVSANRWIGSALGNRDWLLESHQGQALDREIRKVVDKLDDLREDIEKVFYGGSPKLIRRR